MSIDNSKLAYLSTWDIDQLIASDVVSVGSGTTAVYSITGSVTLPIFEVQFKPTGSSFWYRPGNSSTNGTFAGVFTVYTYISGSSVFITTTIAGTARYFIWSDKVNY